jgi:NAD(P)H-dependent flavin oxidoreductase YrpB (nitropropane dioxygenase family)
MLQTRITQLLKIRHPIVQGGMRGLGLAPLAAAVSNAGALGMLSAHTHPDAEALRREIERTRALTDRPFGVNLTVLPSLGSRDFDGYARVIVEMGVPVVETSGGNPAKYIALFKQHGITVLHKVSSSLRFALKAQDLGADAVTLHGFECAGHPGEDDIPGLVLIPAAARQLRLPVLCSGGIADGRGLAAVLALGGEGVVMGTRFMLTQESALHDSVKERLRAAGLRDTAMVGRTMRDPARVWRNGFVERVLEAERQGTASAEEFHALVDAERWMAASRRGDADDGAYPSGLSLGVIDDVPLAAQAVEAIVAEAESTIRARLAAMVNGSVAKFK